MQLSTTNAYTHSLRVHNSRAKTFFCRRSCALMPRRSRYTEGKRKRASRHAPAALALRYLHAITYVLRGCRRPHTTIETSRGTVVWAVTKRVKKKRLEGNAQSKKNHAAVENYFSIILCMRAKVNVCVLIEKERENAR